MAAGILAIGFMLVATTFPVGVALTARATERTLAAQVANEAFAKIKLYGIEPNPEITDPDGNPVCVDFYDIAGRFYTDNDSIGVDEESYADKMFAFPSVHSYLKPDEKKYHWSALCRYIDASTAQVTVFVSRLTGAGRVLYPHPLDPKNPDLYVERPRPIRIKMDSDAADLTGSEIVVHDDDYIVAADEVPLCEYIEGECTLIEESTGIPLIVIEKSSYIDDDPDSEYGPRKLTLKEPLPGRIVDIVDANGYFYVYAIPKASTGNNRYPCIHTAQYTISNPTVEPVSKKVPGDPDVCFILRWDYTADAAVDYDRGPDLDLVVTRDDGTDQETLPDYSDPDGDMVYDFGPTPIFGGIMTHDDSGDYEYLDPDGDPKTRGDGGGPERIYWPGYGDPPNFDPTAYEVSVAYRAISPSAGDLTSYTLELYVNGELQDTLSFDNTAGTFAENDSHDYIITGALLGDYKIDTP